MSYFVLIAVEDTQIEGGAFHDYRRVEVEKEEDAVKLMKLLASTANNVKEYKGIK